MTADLKTQVETYGEQLLEGQLRLSSAEILAAGRQIREIPAPPAWIGRGRPRRGLWVAVAAVIVVLVALIPLLLLGLSRLALLPCLGPCHSSDLF